MRFILFTVESGGQVTSMKTHRSCTWIGPAQVVYKVAIKHKRSRFVERHWWCPWNALQPSIRRHFRRERPKDKETWTSLRLLGAWACIRSRGKRQVTYLSFILQKYRSWDTGFRLGVHSIVMWTPPKRKCLKTPYERCTCQAWRLGSVGCGKTCPLFFWLGGALLDLIGGS